MKYSGIFLMQWYSIVILLIALFCGPRVDDTMSDFRNFGITFIFQGFFPACLATFLDVGENRICSFAPKGER